MKKCQRCAKAATLHITELNEGDVKALHLCEGCAQEYLTTVEPGEIDSDPAFSMEGEDPGEDGEAEEFDDSGIAACPNCGITFKEFRKQGRLGCPQDYLVFEEALAPLLENIHGDLEHIGKTPRRAPEGSDRQYELIRLRNDLRTAVEAEDYESAADIRDRIGRLERDLVDDE